MTDATIIIVLAAIPTTLAALGGCTASVIGAWRTGKALLLADRTHTLVNSNHQAIKQELELAKQKIQALETLIATLIEAKGRAEKTADQAVSTIADIHHKEQH